MLPVCDKKTEQQRHGLAAIVAKKTPDTDLNFCSFLQHSSLKAAMPPETANRPADLALTRFFELEVVGSSLIFVYRIERKTRYDHGCLPFFVA